MSNVNAFLDWRDNVFSLLFHASLENCPEALDYLLERDADPSLKTSREGTCVLQLMAKRGQVEMAEKCYSYLPTTLKLKFINSSTSIGKK